MNDVSRKVLKDLVTQWAKGGLTEVDVHEKAEEWWEQRDWPHYIEEDPRSIAVEVLSHLDTLNCQLITKDDIPAIISFLDTPEGLEKDGWKAWKQYWENVDFETRKQDLKDNPYYCI